LAVALLVAVLLALAVLLLQAPDAHAQTIVFWPGRDDAADRAYRYCSWWYKYYWTLYPYQTDYYCNWYANTYWKNFYGLGW
jgi:hypothetical protein